MEKKLDALVDEVVELFGGVATDNIRQDTKKILKEAYELGYADGIDNGCDIGYADAVISLERSGELESTATV